MTNFLETAQNKNIIFFFCFVFFCYSSNRALNIWVWLEHIFGQMVTEKTQFENMYI